MKSECRRPQVYLSREARVFLVPAELRRLADRMDEVWAKRRAGDSLTVDYWGDDELTISITIDQAAMGDSSSPGGSGQLPPAKAWGLAPLGRHGPCHSSGTNRGCVDLSYIERRFGRLTTGATPRQGVTLDGDLPATA